MITTTTPYSSYIVFVLFCDCHGIVTEGKVKPAQTLTFEKRCKTLCRLDHVPNLAIGSVVPQS